MASLKTEKPVFTYENWFHGLEFAIFQYLKTGFLPTIIRKILFLEPYLKPSPTSGSGMVAVRVTGRKKCTYAYQIGNHVYMPDMKTAKNWYLRCSKSSSEKCEARAVMKKDTLEVVSLKKTHTCREDPLDARMMVLEVRSNQ